MSISMSSQMSGSEHRDQTEEFVHVTFSLDCTPVNMTISRAKYEQIRTMAAQYSARHGKAISVEAYIAYEVKISLYNSYICADPACATHFTMRPDDTIEQVLQPTYPTQTLLRDAPKICPCCRRESLVKTHYTIKEKNGELRITTDVHHRG